MRSWLIEPLRSSEEYSGVAPEGRLRLNEANRVQARFGSVFISTTDFSLADHDANGHPHPFSFLSFLLLERNFFFVHFLFEKSISPYGRKYEYTKYTSSIFFSFFSLCLISYYMYYMNTLNMKYIHTI